jgi:uncharacterized Ntn-hydrolase superfamily protein
VLDLPAFSIVARDPRTGDLGVAAASADPIVGGLVPSVSPRGAIAVQARLGPGIARRALLLLDHGIPIDAALRAVLAADPDRDLRQVHGVDVRRGFCHTGARCPEWSGHERGSEWSVAGSGLAGPQVIGAMAGAFRRTAKLPLAERLLAVLEAGQEAGGDGRGQRSAALIVASRQPRLHHDLRVDDHGEPVTELRRIHDAVAER